MKAEIVSIGTELLMGEITDTNASFIASRLPPLGIELQFVSQVGDELDVLVETFKRGLSRSDIIFTTGGLGPTQDDLTREAVAKTFGEEMTVQPDLLEHLEEGFRRRGMPMPPTNIKQATLIPSAVSLPNARGTAPGWWASGNDGTIICMPGPPGELRGIWEEEVLPRLRREARGEVIVSRNIKTSGVSEGGLDEMVAEYLGRDNPYLGLYSKSDGIHLRIIARASTEDEAWSLIAPVEEGLTSIVGPYIWGYDDETPERSAGLLLAQKKLTLATMESCTGGLLASNITEEPLSDGYYNGGMVLHSDDRSAWLEVGIPREVVEGYGVYSEQAAQAMAQAARTRMRADIGLGLTGRAGTDSIDENTPAGAIHIAIAAEDGVSYFPSRLPPRRQVVKRRAASTALIELRRFLNAL